MPTLAQTPALVKALSRLGYDRRVGPFGSVTYSSEGGSPLAVPLIPGAPGFVLKGNAPLSDVEARHEGVHVTGGLPLAVAGKVAGEALGTGATGSYTAPDEVLAYMSQPDSPETNNDMNTISQLAAGSDKMNPLYSKLIQILTQMRRTR